MKDTLCTVSRQQREMGMRSKLLNVTVQWKPGLGQVDSRRTQLVDEWCLEFVPFNLAASVRSQVAWPLTLGPRSLHPSSELQVGPPLDIWPSRSHLQWFLHWRVHTCGFSWRFGTVNSTLTLLLEAAIVTHWLVLASIYSLESCNPDPPCPPCGRMQAGISYPRYVPEISQRVSGMIAN